MPALRCECGAELRVVAAGDWRWRMCPECQFAEPIDQEDPMNSQIEVELDRIEMLAQNTANDAARLEPGNVAHHRGEISRNASATLDMVAAIREKLGMNATARQV